MADCTRKVQTLEGVALSRQGACVVAEIIACARDPNSRDRDVGQVVRDETLSRSRDRDHIPESTLVEQCIMVPSNILF